MRTKDNNDVWVDVSHGMGIPFGGIGTGYGVFGKYGFVQRNFDSFPNPETQRYNGQGPKEAWNYLDEPENKAPYALLISDGKRTWALQETPLAWQPDALPVKKISSKAYLPKGLFTIDAGDDAPAISIEAFSPMIPHDLESSTIPVQVYDITVTNRAKTAGTFTLQLAHRECVKAVGDTAVVEEPTGQIAFFMEGSRVNESGLSVSLDLAGGQSQTVRMYIAWCYPAFKTPSPNATDTYRRYYAKRFSHAKEIIDLARQKADDWSAAIDDWHDSIDVPAYFTRLWFSSLCSVITSTMLSDDPYFFEIETPHSWVGTMDVNVYSSWIYMIHWPEIERMEMNQYLQAIATEGDKKGFVWHSLWDDACEYVEEPIFLTRLWRDYLWFKDRDWLKATLPAAICAADRVYHAGNYEGLIESLHGNQSYDGWKMPGVSTFVNSAWLYALYALGRMASVLKTKTPTIDGMPIGDLMNKATGAYDRLLWNEQQGYWNCFFRTPKAEPHSTPESAFTDQLFGKWVVAIDPGASAVLPQEKVTRALHTLYVHNRIDDSERDFRGWVNGLLPGRKKEPTGQYHAYTFWIGAQLNLGSLLGEVGQVNEEKASLDVFQSLERSLHNNHLAVGEWNQSIDENLKTRPLPEETPKDTPRFPPYPRYKSSWEYLIRLLGLKVDETYLYLQPFRTIDFALTHIRLAGVNLSIRVRKDWRTVTVNSQPAEQPLRLQRDTSHYRIEFR